MNADASTVELRPRWPTYFNAVIFLLPAVISWGFACVFLVPKVVELGERAGIARSAAARIWNPAIFLVHYGRSLLVAVILAVVLLECFSRAWRRYRGTGAGVVVWLLNVTVLFGLTALFTVALIAAPSLTHVQ